MTRDPAKFWAESNAQVAIVAFLRRSLPSTYRVISIPNGRFKADPRTVSRLIREGLTKGALDLIVLRNDGWFCMMEIKADTGKLSTEQAEFCNWLSSGGANAVVIRSLEEAVEALIAFGVPLRGRVAA